MGVVGVGVGMVRGVWMARGIRCGVVEGVGGRGAVMVVGVGVVGCVVGVMVGRRQMGVSTGVRLVSLMVGTRGEFVRWSLVSGMPRTR